jgi:hypothetical protein
VMERLALGVIVGVALFAVFFANWSDEVGS